MENGTGEVVMVNKEMEDELNTFFASVFAAEDTATCQKFKTVGKVSGVAVTKKCLGR